MHFLSVKFSYLSPICITFFFKWNSTNLKKFYLVIGGTGFITIISCWFSFSLFIFYFIQIQYTIHLNHTYRHTIASDLIIKMFFVFIFYFSCCYVRARRLKRFHFLKLVKFVFICYCPIIWHIKKKKLLLIFLSLCVMVTVTTIYTQIYLVVFPLLPLLLLFIHQIRKGMKETFERGKNIYISTPFTYDMLRHIKRHRARTQNGYNSISK